MSYTKYIGSQKKLVARTSKKANIMVSGFHNNGVNAIVVRNVWRDEDDKCYMQWKGNFYTLVGSNDYECEYAMGYIVR